MSHAYGVKLTGESKDLFDDVEHFKKTLASYSIDEQKHYLALFHDKFPHNSPTYLYAMEEFFMGEYDLTDDTCKYVFETYIRPNPEFKPIALNLLEEFEEEYWRSELLNSII